MPQSKPSPARSHRIFPPPPPPRPCTALTRRPPHILTHPCAVALSLLFSSLFITSGFSVGKFKSWAKREIFFGKSARCGGRAENGQVGNFGIVIREFGWSCCTVGTVWLVDLAESHKEGEARTTTKREEEEKKKKKTFFQFFQLFCTFLKFFQFLNCFLKFFQTF
jgi:hypothetical protein